MDDNITAPLTISRRTFVGGVAAAAGVMIVPRRVLGGPRYAAPSDRVNIAAVGYVHGMGTSNIRECAKQNNIVALCDVDESEAAERAFVRSKLPELCPNAVRYRDYRVMLEKQKDIDAVIVATPDHTHAVIAMAAMRARQARLRAEADDADGVGGAAADRGGPPVQGRHADGQPGAFGRGRAPDRGVDRRRRHRQGPRGPLLDEPPDLAAGHATAGRHAAGARRAGLGPVDRAGADAPVSPGLPSLQLARVVRLRLRRARRHGLPRDGRELPGAQARVPDERPGVPRVPGRAGREGGGWQRERPARVQGQLPARDGASLHVPGPQQEAARR